MQNALFVGTLRKILCNGLVCKTANNCKVVILGMTDFDRTLTFFYMQDENDYSLVKMP